MRKLDVLIEFIRHARELVENRKKSLAEKVVERKVKIKDLLERVQVEVECQETTR